MKGEILQPIVRKIMGNWPGYTDFFTNFNSQSTQ